MKKTGVTFLGRYDIQIRVRGLVAPLFFSFEEANDLRNQLNSVIRQIHRKEERDEEDSG